MTEQSHDLTDEAPPPGPWLNQPDGGQNSWADEGPHPGPSWPDSSERSAGVSPVQALLKRPEFVIGAAFAGGLVLAAIIKRLAR